MSHDPNRYIIAVKSNKVGHANFVKYRGDCYYRMYKNGVVNTVPTSAVTPFYPNQPCFDSPALTSMPLCCASCTDGESQLFTDGMIQIPDQDKSLQFRFNPTKDKDFGYLQLMFGENFETKTLQLCGEYLVFDRMGKNEHVFHVDSHPHAYTFTSNVNYYCLNYVAKGSYVFTMSVDSTGLGSTITIPPDIVTPTPTPTPTHPVGYEPDSGPDGKNYYATMWWPTSGEVDLLAWYDAAHLDSVELDTDNESIMALKTRWVNGPTLRSIEFDAPDKNKFNIRRPRIKTTGGVGGGPSINFKIDGEFGGQYLSTDITDLTTRYDIRALFVVASWDHPQFNSERFPTYNGLITGTYNTKQQDSNLMVGAWTYNIWMASSRRSPTRMIAKSVYSHDRGDYYVNGCLIDEGNGQSGAVIGQYVTGYKDATLHTGINITGQPTNTPGICLGGEYCLTNGAQRGWYGNVAEVIMLTSEPTKEQQDDIEGYLAWKWGLAEHLCKTHKWKLTPPVPLPPTPTPKPPPPTPTPTSLPPLPRGVPVGVNQVTMTQLLDVVSQRTHPATLWIGGYYDYEWETMTKRLSLLSSDSLVQALSSNVSSVIQGLNTSTVDITQSWRSHIYMQDDVDCGTANKVIKLGLPEGSIDEVDNRVMYCLDHINAGDSINMGKTLLEVTQHIQLDDNPDPVNSPTLWNLFVNTIYNVDAKTGINTVKYSTDQYNRHLEVLEDKINIPFLIETPSFSYNTLQDFQTPLTTIYRIPAPTHSMLISNQSMSGLRLAAHTTRVDLVIDLVYEDLVLWNDKVYFDDGVTVDVSVSLPGANADLTDYVNQVGDLEWKINVEVTDNKQSMGSYQSITGFLPKQPGLFIPGHIKRVHASLGDYLYSVTPYAGDFRAQSSDEIISNISKGKYPRLFVRIDRLQQ